MKVIYMHGIGKHDEKDKLKATWDKALFGKVQGEKTSMAYWADLRKPDHELEKLALIGAEAKQIASGIKDPQLAELTASMTQEIASHFDQINAKALESRFLSPIPPEVADLILKLLIKDVALYFFDGNAREKIKQRLIDELDKADECIIIGHSMGTVITYDVLREYSRSGFKPVLYMTLGSPLGLDTVQRNLKVLAGKDPEEKLTTPSAPSIWSNFSSIGDPVCLDMELSDDFVLSVNSNRLDDYHVINPRLLSGDPHSIEGYLSINEIQAQVRILTHSTDLDMVSV